MDPISIAAGIIGIGTGIYNTITGRKDRKENIKIQQSEARRAEQVDLERWHLQNQYNSPTAQMSRLRQAGLNPNLIYGRGATQTAGAVGAAREASGDQAQTEAGQSLYNNIATAAQIDNLRKQNDVMQQESLLKSANAAESASRTAKNRFDLGLAEDLRKTSLEAAELNVQNIEQDIIGKRISNYTNDTKKQAVIKEAFYRAQTAQQQFKGAQLDNAIKSIQKDLWKAGINPNDPTLMRILGEPFHWGSKKIKSLLPPWLKN